MSESCVLCSLGQRMVWVGCDGLLGCNLLLIRWFGFSSCLGKGRALHSSIVRNYAHF